MFERCIVAKGGRVAVRKRVWFVFACLSERWRMHISFRQMVAVWVILGGSATIWSERGLTCYGNEWRRSGGYAWLGLMMGIGARQIFVLSCAHPKTNGCGDRVRCEMLGFPFTYVISFILFFSCYTKAFTIIKKWMTIPELRVFLFISSCMLNWTNGYDWIIEISLLNVVAFDTNFDLFRNYT